MTTGHRRAAEHTVTTLSVRGADGDTLVGERVGTGPLVVLLHGGGQTRQSWARTAQRLAAAGRTALTFDLRGHGDSDWSAGGRYAMQDNVRDLQAVLGTLDERPALIGASLGGLTALMTVADSDDGGLHTARCLVLVDVAPKLEAAGLNRVRTFMLASPDGFASVEEAADAVAAYLPDRPRPGAAPGLLKNLRLGLDQRYHWHWDPRILTDMPDQDEARHAMLTSAAARVRVPTLLVRGGRSDVVSDDGVRELQHLIPHAEVTEVGQAGHMIAGADNDDFTAAMVSFVCRD